jgi:CubicO group peptidase (beta-lactamase class C family)
MREVLGERLGHGRADAGPAAPARPRPGRADLAPLTVAALTLVHLVDHVLRADASGWPFTRDLTWFTASLLVYPALLAGLLLYRSRPWVRVAMAALLLGAVQLPHMFWETPADQYGTWAHGVSWMPATPGRPNLPGISAPALGAVSVAVAVALSVALPVALVLLAGDLRRFRRPGRVAAAALLVLVLGVDLAYGWAWASTDRSRLARTIVWQESDVSDYRRFPARPVPTRPPAFRFRRSPAADRLPVATVPVRQGGRLAERDLEGFLRSTGTEAFLAVRGDTLVFEAYFHGYRHDSRVSSFSVAKPVVSALVGIAIAQGRIGSVDDPVTRYLPELADRDPRFGTITLRHLLTMSSGLADLDPYYDLDLRAVALRDTRIAGPAGRRFHYNNVNPVLLGMVLERATGRTVSTYLSERLWGPLGMEADGSWSLDSRRSGLELLQAGLNGRAVDFAKLGALYLHGGVWRGHQLVPRRWVADSTRADTRTDPSSRFQYDWWTRPGTGPGNDFWAQGNHGQFVYVAPSRDVVLVRFGTGYHYDHWPDLLATLARRL